MSKLMRNRSESGYTLLEFPVFLAGMLIFLTMLVELGNFGFMNLSADNASYAACRALSQDVTLTTDDLEDIATTASPSLGNCEVAVDRSVVYSDSEYTHHLPSGGEFEDRESNAARYEVKATVTCSYDPLTWLGVLMCSYTGTSDIVISSYHSGVADATIDQGVSRW